MIRALAFAFALITPVHADWGIDAVGLFSTDLGYEKVGFGLQLDADGRHGNWGWEAQASAYKHGKRDAVGERYQAIALGRRYFDDVFIEVGGEWGGYESRFDDGKQWVKYGVAPAVGAGLLRGDTEWSLRYFLPDSTPNATYVFAGAVETPINDSMVIAVVAETWRFKQSGETLTGTQIAIEWGWRFR